MRTLIVPLIGLYMRAGTRIGNTLINRYFKNTKWIKNPVSNSERAKLDRLVKLFRKYGEKYSFDWLALAAQGYQESALNHSAKSRAGAVGIMQLLPSTAKDPNVGIPDISSEENNIHAGAKYLAFVRNIYKYYITYQSVVAREASREDAWRRDRRSKT